MNNTFPETDNTDETEALTEETAGCSEDETWPRNSVSRRVYDVLEEHIDDWSVREYYRLVRALKDKELTDDLILEEHHKIREKIKAYEQRLKNTGRNESNE